MKPTDTPIAAKRIDAADAGEVASQQLTAEAEATPSHEAVDGDDPDTFVPL